MIRLRRQPPQPPAGLPGLDAVEVGPRELGINDGRRATFAVVAYPREVPTGWLEPLVTYPGPIDVALHIEPLPAALAAERLRRQLARLESSRRLDAEKGRLADPALDAATEDARTLAEALARGEGRLFQVGLYITVRATTRDELTAEVTRVRTLLASLLLDTVPVTFRQLHGWLSTLPLGLDLLRQRRTMDTAALAAAFPFASVDLPEPAGVLYGVNVRSRGLVMWDRWNADNYNLVVLARSGAGKSYLAKLDALRWAYHGVDVLVVDPEDEYHRLAETVGGTTIRLGAPGVRFNPFDLPHTSEPDALVRRALFLHTLVGVLLGEPSSGN